MQMYLRAGEQGRISNLEDAYIPLRFLPLPLYPLGRWLVIMSIGIPNFSSLFQCLIDFISYMNDLNEIFWAIALRHEGRPPPHPTEDFEEEDWP